jgi:hypothetical protein
VCLEGLGKLKKTTSLGIEPATFRLAADSLRYRVPFLKKERRLIIKKNCSKVLNCQSSHEEFELIGVAGISLSEERDLI